MSKQQLWSIVVLVVMVGSLFAFISYDSRGSNNPAQTQQPSPGQQQSATQVSYTAKAVPAKVLEIFPTAILVGTTSEFSVSGVDAQLRKVPGVTAVAGSEFFSPPDRSANFRTNLRFTSKDRMKAGLKAIEDRNILSNLSLFPAALVSVPYTINFRNDDAGLTLDYNSLSHQAQVVATIDTEKGDDISITLNADFRGQELVNLTGVIEKNNTSSPQYSLVNDTYRIAKLDSTFTLDVSASAAKRTPLLRVRDFFSSSQDYNSALSLKRKTSETKLYFTFPSTVLPADLNTFLTGYKGLESFALYLDQNYASVVVPLDQNDYSGFVSKLAQDLGAVSFKVKSIKDPVLEVSGLVTGVRADRHRFLSDVNAVQSSDTPIISVLQKARIDTNSIFVQDQNADYVLSGGSFYALVSPVHAIGDSVGLSVTLVGNKRAGVMRILDAHEAGTESPLQPTFSGGLGSA